eukprot:scaffold417_cov252-Pinguiococcus_pyrenoidosus.AAC.14
MAGLASIWFCKGQQTSTMLMRNSFHCISSSSCTYASGDAPRRSAARIKSGSVRRSTSAMSTRGLGFQQASCSAVRCMSSTTQTDAPRDTRSSTIRLWPVRAAMWRMDSPKRLHVLGDRPSSRNFFTSS